MIYMVWYYNIFSTHTRRCYRSECRFVAEVNYHSSLIAALNKHKDQESRLNEVVNAHEKLKQQNEKVEEGKK